MTYLAGSVQSLVTDRNTWHTRADQAWGTSRSWSVGNSFETDLTSMTADRNAWHTNADQAWGPSRQYNVGNSFETNYTNLLATYNALLNGLNNPEGLQSQGFAISHNAGGSQAHFGDFAVGRAGHFFIAVLLPVHCPNITAGNANMTLILGGTAGVSLNQNFNVGTNSGSKAGDFLMGGAWDLNVSAGATISIDFNAFVTGNPTTGTCTVYAHFVPNATNHN